ncbi:MAG: uncharacterized protein KVP18_002138 [Porospora cf. gigantea A]|uniref:uncharacterized protein n=2 Tax=Porospora cf. gigantea A TaxID=2853593 RepID=UPI00355A20AB|nr:MAG: hypothetical protein KVP18_002138 [Porospora cf. gigantea A]
MSLFDTANLIQLLQTRESTSELETGIQVQAPQTYFQSSTKPFNVEASHRDCTLTTPSGYEPQSLTQEKSVLDAVSSGEPVPLNDSKESRRRRRAEKAARLEKWFGMPAQTNVSPETVKEIQALEFRGMLQRKKGRRMRQHQSLGVPKYFHMATEVAVGLADRKIGEKTRVISKDRKTDRKLATILQDLMANLNQEASPADTKALQKSVDVLTRQLVIAAEDMKRMAEQRATERAATKSQTALLRDENAALVGDIAKLEERLERETAAVVSLELDSSRLEVLERELREKEMVVEKVKQEAQEAVCAVKRQQRLSEERESELVEANRKLMGSAVVSAQLQTALSALEEEQDKWRSAQCEIERLQGVQADLESKLTLRKDENEQQMHSAVLRKYYDRSSRFNRIVLANLLGWDANVVETTCGTEMHLRLLTPENLGVFKFTLDTSMDTVIESNSVDPMDFEFHVTGKLKTLWEKDDKLRLKLAKLKSYPLFLAQLLTELSPDQ